MGAGNPYGDSSLDRPEDGQASAATTSQDGQLKSISNWPALILCWCAPKATMSTISKQGNCKLYESSAWRLHFPFVLFLSAFQWTSTEESLKQWESSSASLLSQSSLVTQTCGVLVTGYKRWSKTVFPPLTYGKQQYGSDRLERKTLHKGKERLQRKKEKADGSEMTTTDRTMPVFRPNASLGVCFNN